MKFTIVAFAIGFTATVAGALLVAAALAGFGELYGAIQRAYGHAVAQAVVVLIGVGIFGGWRVATVDYSRRKRRHRTRPPNVE